MRVIRIFTGADFRSHFEDFELPLPHCGAYSRYSDAIPVTQATFRETPPQGFYGLHNPPTRQLVLVMAGRVEFTCGNGDRRILGPGDLMLAEDLIGEGHSSRELEGSRRSVFLPLAPGAVLPGRQSPSP